MFSFITFTYCAWEQVYRVPHAAIVFKHIPDYKRGPDLRRELELYTVLVFFFFVGLFCFGFGFWRASTGF
jgi:hypothetical protein